MPLGDRPLFPRELHWSGVYITLAEVSDGGRPTCTVDTPALAKVIQVCHFDVVGIFILLICQEIREIWNLLLIEMTANILSFFTLS